MDNYEHNLKTAIRLIEMLKTSEGVVISDAIIFGDVICSLDTPKNTSSLQSV